MCRPFMAACPNAVYCLGRERLGTARQPTYRLYNCARCAAQGRLRTDPPARVATTYPSALPEEPRRGPAACRPATAVAGRRGGEQNTVTHRCGNQHLSVTTRDSSCVVLTCGPIHRSDTQERPATASVASRLKPAYFKNARHRQNYAALFSR
jgi:hypothetical protein